VSFGGFVAYRNNRINRTVAAAKNFRSAINPEAFNDIRGHILHGALIKHFPVLKIAVHEYRIYLGLFDRIRLNRAWKEYHGGNEKHPNLFNQYCLPTNGPVLLKDRLKKLKENGEKR
jgi:hypothetical protein